MPLTPWDKRFLDTVDRLKIYLIIMAAGVLLFLLCTPASQIHLTTAIVSVALCGVLWLTQRLLTFITLLDLELTKAIEALKRAVSDDWRRDPPGR